MPRKRRNRRDPTGGANSDDSDCPRSELVKYNSDQVEDFHEICKSIVSLSSTYDGTFLLACSGTVVDHVGSQTWILTSATLVRKPGSQYEAYDSGNIKIKVVLHDTQTVEGSLEVVNLHYNLAIVTIKSPTDLPALELSDLPVVDYMGPMSVVALGRGACSTILMKCGKLIRENSELDCNELLVCTCDVNENFIGGPVMDLGKRFLGITYLYKATMPFLPVGMAARCLKSFKSKTLLPRLLISGQAVHMLDLPVLERLCCKYAVIPSGILVNKVDRTSLHHFGGIDVGDIILELDGVPLCSVAQFSVLLLDKWEAEKSTQNTVTLQASVKRPPDITFVAELNVGGIFSEEFGKLFQNRWIWQPKKRWFM